MKRIAAIWLGALLGACGGQPAVERPPRAQAVIELGQQGQAAYTRGDLARAARQFEQALSDAKRIEDSEAVAAMSVNLARVRREAGDSAAAIRLLDAVSPWHRDNAGERHRGEMELLAAVLLADLNRRDEALARVQILREQCRTACTGAIGIESLYVRLLLEKAEAGAAAQFATGAIERFRGHGNRLELANLFRVQGEARLALGDFAGARQALDSALDIDKSLGLPAKIAQDLDALARTALAAGDTSAHAAYAARLGELRSPQVSPRKPASN